MTRLPDFIIIGAMKCATSTLHEQLARQAGIFMSTPKEPNFFSNDEEWSRGAEWYASLFESAPVDAFCGESSTHYTKLPTYPRTIERMSGVLLPNTKFIYIMRHPIDRLISQYMHEWSQRIINGPIDDAIDAFPMLIDYSRYAMQIEPFLKAFGSDRICPVFFERLSEHPQGELERVARFLGYRGAVRWDDSLQDQNASNQRLRSSAVRDAIVNAPGLARLRRVLIPQSWRDRIKQFWMMRSRPELSPASLATLNRIFNDDLARLGAWLNLDLNCDNFRQIAVECEPHWVLESRSRAVVA